MIKVRMLSTGLLEDVTPNVAHDLIDRGLAEVFRVTPTYQPPKNMKPNVGYYDRQMRTRQKRFAKAF
jgi:hypothetical protein